MLLLKKSLGQHLLRDEAVLQRIAEAVGDSRVFETLIEIGPGMGALTKYLVAMQHPNFYVIELDDRWAAHLPQVYPTLKNRVIHEDFLQCDLTNLLRAPAHIVGNFPYNISSQIVFKIIDHCDSVAQMTGMFQKEVGLRIAAKPHSKDYGVLSILTQAYYDAEYLFDVPPSSFEPPPKVMSGIVRIKRKSQALQCDEKLFKQLVKQAFTQRRKTMRNSLKSYIIGKEISNDVIFEKRPEQLDVNAFQQLTNMITTAQ